MGSGSGALTGSRSPGESGFGSPRDWTARKPSEQKTGAPEGRSGGNRPHRRPFRLERDEGVQQLGHRGGDGWSGRGIRLCA